MEHRILGNTVTEWLIATGSVLLSLGVVTVLRGSLVRRLEAVSARTETILDDYLVVLLQALRPIFVVLAAVAWALLSLEIPAAWVLVCKWLLVFSLVVQAFHWVNKTVAFWVSNYEKTHGAAVDRAAVMIITFGVRLAFWVIIGLETLRYFHKSPTTLLAGLGVSGIALALAVQNVLGDLLAALSIMLDKPFVVGDTIAADGSVRLPIWKKGEKITPEQFDVVRDDSMRMRYGVRTVARARPGTLFWDRMAGWPYAFEQGTHNRKPPTLTPPLKNEP